VTWGRRFGGRQDPLGYLSASDGRQGDPLNEVGAKPISRGFRIPYQSDRAFRSDCSLVFQSDLTSIRSIRPVIGTDAAPTCFGRGRRFLGSAYQAGGASSAGWAGLPEAATVDQPRTPSPHSAMGVSLIAIQPATGHTHTKGAFIWALMDFYPLVQAQCLLTIGHLLFPYLGRSGAAGMSAGVASVSISQMQHTSGRQCRVERPRCLP
jgi:hypothetical protein